LKAAWQNNPSYFWAKRAEKNLAKTRQAIFLTLDSLPCQWKKHGLSQLCKPSLPPPALMGQ